MKKIAVIFGILAVLAAACFAYRYYVAFDRLRSITLSGQYRALGLRLTVSAPAGGVKGLLHLQPYLEIPQVSLDAAEWGNAVPLPLGKGRLETGLWNNTGLRLVLDAGSAAGGEVEFERLAFELGLPDRILGARARSFRFVSQAPFAGKSLTFQEPQLQLHPGEDRIPSQLQLRTQAVTWENRLSNERLQLGATEFRYDLTPNESDWKWRTYFRGQGFVSHSGEIQGEVRPWTLVLEGVTAKWDEARSKAWRDIWTTFPSKGSWTLPFLTALLTQLRPRIDQLDFRWSGLDIKQEKAWQMRMEPLDFSIRYLPEAGGHGWRMSGHWKSLSSNVGPQRRFEVNGLAFDETIHYRGLSYEQWLDLAMRYYREFSVNALSSSKSASNPELFYLPYLAQMPDELQGELSCQRLNWVRPDYQTEHRNLVFSFGAKKDGLNYRLRGDFDSQGPSGFLPNVKDGKLDFSFSFLLPYAEVIAAARARSQAESQPSTGLPFAGKDSGLDWKWRADLGAESFALDLDLLMKADLGAWLLAMPVGKSAVDWTKVGQDFPSWFLKEGKLQFHLKVGRLSKLQAAMEKIKTGSSMALGLAGAYVIVDPKADTLSLELNLEAGTITLNGKRNASLEALLRKKAGAGP